MNVIVVAPPCSDLHAFLRTLKEFIVSAKRGKNCYHHQIDEWISESFEEAILTANEVKPDDMASHYAEYLMSLATLNPDCIKDAGAKRARKYRQTGCPDPYISVGPYSRAGALQVKAELPDRPTFFVVMSVPAKTRMTKVEDMVGGGNSVQVDEKVLEEVVGRIDSAFSWPTLQTHWEPDHMTPAADEIHINLEYGTEAEQIEAASLVLATLLKS